MSRADNLLKTNENAASLEKELAKFIDSNGVLSASSVFISALRKRLKKEQDKDMKTEISKLIDRLKL